MTTVDLVDQMKELLNKDRLRYIEMIMGSGIGLASLDIAGSILASKNIRGAEEISRQNAMVNKRLRKLVDLGILMQIEEGRYTMSSLGYLLMDSWSELSDRVKIMEKFHDFFENHYVDNLPKEFFRQIYKIRKAELTENPIQWMRKVAKYTGEAERKLYNLTEYLHDIPEDILRKISAEKTGGFEIVIIYEFCKYPELNYADEKEVFKRLVDAGVEFRYITLEERHPIDLRIVDEKWATFGLTRISDGVLDRDQAFVGTDPDFISWCRDLMYHMWHFVAKPLASEQVMANGEK